MGSAKADPAGPAPTALQLPQLGTMRFTCDPGRGVQPIFDMYRTTSEEEVTLRAGSITRRNFEQKVVGHSHGKTLIEAKYAPGLELALPFGHYRSATAVVHQGTEAVTLDGTVRATFVVRTLKRNALAGVCVCYVKRWSSQLDVH